MSSIADAVRARELEARVATLCRTTALIQGQVAELERRVALIEREREPGEQTQAMRLVQGQLNSLRARLDKADAPR